MEVLLIGANKGLGYQVLKELLSKKITVNCLIRRKGLINFESKYLNIFYGDATNLSDLKKSIGNSECIISTINVQRKNIFPWSRLTNSKTTISDFAKNSIIATEDKINRIITRSICCNIDLNCPITSIWFDCVCPLQVVDKRYQFGVCIR